MAYNCLIIDDEPLARKVIREYLDDIPEIDVVSECSSALEAMNYLKNQTVDILYLDINMPKLSGFQLLEQITNPPIVVFTTAYPEYAVEAFDVEAFDYLVKPISFDRFLKTTKRIIEHLTHNKSGSLIDDASISIKENKRLYKVLSNNIYYVKAFGDYVRVFTTDKTYITKFRLHKFCENLPGNFIQIHRSFFINLNHLEYLEGNHIQINGEKIPVSESFKEELLKRI